MLLCVATEKKKGDQVFFCFFLKKGVSLGPFLLLVARPIIGNVIEKDELAFKLLFMDLQRRTIFSCNQLNPTTKEIFFLGKKKNSMSNVPKQ